MAIDPRYGLRSNPRAGLDQYAEDIRDAQPLSEAEAFDRAYGKGEQDFQRGLRSFIEQRRAGGYANRADEAEKAGDIEEAERLRDLARMHQYESQAYNAPRMEDIRSESAMETAGNAVDWVQGLAGSLVPYAGTSAAAAGALRGALAGARVGGGLASAVGLVGGALSSYPTNRDLLSAGQMADEHLMQRTTAEERLREASRTGLLQAGLELGAPLAGVRVASRTAGALTRSPTAIARGQRSATSRIAQDIFTEAPLEGFTEVAQTLAEQASMDRLNPNRDRSMDKQALTESLIAGIVGGALFGGVSATPSIAGAALRTPGRLAGDTLSAARQLRRERTGFDRTRPDFYKDSPFDTNVRRQSVLTNEEINQLSPEEYDAYVDRTFGLGTESDGLAADELDNLDQDAREAYVAELGGVPDGNVDEFTRAAQLADELTTQNEEFRRGIHQPLLEDFNSQAVTQGKTPEFRARSRIDGFLNALIDTGTLTEDQAAALSNNVMQTSEYLRRADADEETIGQFLLDMLQRRQQSDNGSKALNDAEKEILEQFVVKDKEGKTRLRGSDPVHTEWTALGLEREIKKLKDLNNDALKGIIKKREGQLASLKKGKKKTLRTQANKAELEQDISNLNKALERINGKKKKTETDKKAITYLNSVLNTRKKELTRLSKERAPTKQKMLEALDKIESYQMVNPEMVPGTGERILTGEQLLPFYFNRFRKSLDLSNKETTQKNRHRHIQVKFPNRNKPFTFDVQDIDNTAGPLYQTKKQGEGLQFVLAEFYKQGAEIRVPSQESINKPDGKLTWEALPESTEGVQLLTRRIKGSARAPATLTKQDPLGERQAARQATVAAGNRVARAQEQTARQDIDGELVGPDVVRRMRNDNDGTILETREVAQTPDGKSVYADFRNDQRIADDIQNIYRNEQDGSLWEELTDGSLRINGVRVNAISPAQAATLKGKNQGPKLRPLYSRNNKKGIEYTELYNEGKVSQQTEAIKKARAPHQARLNRLSKETKNIRKLNVRKKQLERLRKGSQRKTAAARFELLLRKPELGKTGPKVGLASHLPLADRFKAINAQQEGIQQQLKDRGFPAEKVFLRHAKGKIDFDGDITTQGLFKRWRELDQHAKDLKKYHDDLNKEITDLEDSIAQAKKNAKQYSQWKDFRVKAKAKAKREYDAQYERLRRMHKRYEDGDGFNSIEQWIETIQDVRDNLNNKQSNTAEALAQFDAQFELLRPILDSLPNHTGKQRTTRVAVSGFKKDLSIKERNRKGR